MTQKDLLVAIAKESGLTQADVKKSVDAFCGVVQGLKEGESVVVRKFGTFAKKRYAARKVTPPGMAEMTVPSQVKLTFKASKVKK